MTTVLQHRGANEWYHCGLPARIAIALPSLVRAPLYVQFEQVVCKSFCQQLFRQ